MHLSKWYLELLTRRLPGSFRSRHEAELLDICQEMRAELGTRPSVFRRLRFYVDLTMDVLRQVRDERARTKRRARRVMDNESLARAPDLAFLISDARYAVRQLVRSPGYTVAAVATLGLGIGATTTIFTLVHTVVLSPLPFDEPDRLVAIQHTAPSRGLDDAGQSAAWHLTYEDENSVLEDIGMYGTGSVAVTGVGDPEALPAMFASSGVFRALRLRPVAGRIFTPDDEVPGAPNALLLSHGYWQTRFGGEAAVIGRTIQVDGGTWEVVGVLPPTVRGLATDPALILPMRFNRATLFVGNIGFDAVARLRDDVTVEDATANLAQIMPMAWEKFPGGPVSSSSESDQYTPVVRLFKDDLLGSSANLLWVLLGGVGIVLLIACANVGNLFLVRAEGKQGEMAVRTALGASRNRIGWEYVKESLLLGVLGGVTGLALAYSGLRGLVAAAPPGLPRLEDVALSPAVLVFTLGVSLGTGVLLGMFPFLRLGGQNLVNALRQGGTAGMSGRDRHSAQNVLAVSQMALALVLLIASGLMLRSFQSLRNVDPGFANPDEILTLRLSIPSREIEDRAQTALAFEQIARRLGEIPGVASVGMATGVPMGGGDNVNPFYADGFAPRTTAATASRRHRWVGEGYFETMRIPLLLGRTFTWDDVHNRFPGAILSESLAREFFGSPEEAMGQRVAARPEPARWHEVVGVAADVRDDGMDHDPQPTVYWPQVTLAFWEGSAADQIQTWRSMGYAIRTERVGTADLLGAVRGAIWEVNPNLPVRGVRPLSDLMAQSMARTSFSMMLLGIAGGMALLLGIVGVYGVISYAVSQRSRELGMRIALGAQARQVRAMVLRQGLRLCGMGVAIGLVLSLILSRLMAGLLFGVQPTDPLTYGAVATVLTAVALAASYLPARRAASVDPMRALRLE